MIVVVVVVAVLVAAVESVLVVASAGTPCVAVFMVVLIRPWLDCATCL